MTAMKWLIAIAFVGAAISVGLSYAAVLSPTSMIPPLCFAAGLILVLVHLVNEGDRRY